MIVNADDFGARADINAAVVRAFSEGLVSSATVMPNLGGFEEACQLAHEQRLLDHVGVHLVLNEGRPLTEPIRGCRRFCDAEGNFCLWQGEARVLRLTPAERRAVHDEVTAQVLRCRAHGLPLTHADSHHHAHTELGVTTVVARVARELGLAAVRLMQNAGEMRLRRRIYVSAVNARLRAAGLGATRWFGTWDDHARLRARGVGAAALDSFELMTHPVLSPSGMLVDALEGERPFAELVDGLGPVRMTSFSGARLAG